MNKIPTAREFIMENRDRFQGLSAHIWLIEFARLHVKAALEAARVTSNLKWCAGESGVLTREDIELIYPENLIV